MREYDIDPLTMHELLEPSLKPRAEDNDEYLYLVLRFPSIRDDKMLSEQEIDFILGKDFLITTRYQAIQSFEELKKILETHSVTSSADGIEDEQDSLIANSKYKYATDLFFELVAGMYDIVERQIDEVRDDLEDIEENIFNEKEREMVFALSNTGRDILNLRQALDPHDNILQSLKGQIEKYSSKDHKSSLRLIENMYYKLQKDTQQLWQSLNELRETNNSLLTTKQNEVMKIFTILAFVTFPLSLVSSIFGMNTEYIPITGLHLNILGFEIKDFWVVISLMTLATILMFMYFKKKRWI